MSHGVPTTDEIEIATSNQTFIEEQLQEQVNFYQVSFNA